MGKKEGIENGGDPNNETTLATTTVQSIVDGDPPIHTASLAIILTRNLLGILTFSIVVPTSEAYASALGASRLFR